MRLLAAAAPADATYARTQLTAFAVSWVRSLAPVVVNQPTPGRSGFPIRSGALQRTMLDDFRRAGVRRGKMPAELADRISELRARFGTASRSAAGHPPTTRT